MHPGNYIGAILPRMCIILWITSARVPAVRRRPARGAGQSSNPASSSGGAAGNRTVNFAPAPGWLLASTVPPWALMVCATIDNPRPVPGVLRALLER